MYFNDILIENKIKYEKKVIFSYLNLNGYIVNKTYIDFYNDINLLKNLLIEKNLMRSKIILLSENSYEWIVSFFAIIATNNIVVPLDNRLDKEKIFSLSKEVDAKFIFVNQRNMNLIPNNLLDDKYFVLEDLHNLKNYNDIDVKTYNEDCCMIMFTSGTTGTNKGVMLSQKNLILNAKASFIHSRNSNNYKELSVLPFFHIFVLSIDILWSVIFGVELVIGNGIPSLIDDIKKFKISRVCFVPMLSEYIYNNLLKESKKNPKLNKDIIKDLVLGTDFKRIISGGAYINRELRTGLMEYGLEVIVGYGMTETSPVISSEEGIGIKQGSVGEILSCNQVKIIDDEICVKGDSVMSGYFNNKKSTDEIFVDGWLHTGDIGYVDEDNYLYIIGKKKNLIITGNGENVAPEELESKLMANEIIKEIIVYQKENQICAEIYPNFDLLNTQDEKIVINLLKEKINDLNSKNPSYKHIHNIIIRNTEFEKTSTMKLKRDNYYYKK